MGTGGAEGGSEDGRPSDQGVTVAVAVPPTLSEHSGQQREVTAMSLGVSPRAEHWPVRAWLAIYLVCAALGVYSTAKTAADLIKDESTQAAAPLR